MVSLGGASFADLDIDGDGYLSKLEAKEDTRLTEEWDQIDKDHDERIDRVEFAAFETGATMEFPDKGSTAGKSMQSKQKSGP
jgi:hypothetical protein